MRRRLQLIQCSAKHQPVGSAREQDLVPELDRRTPVLIAVLGWGHIEKVNPTQCAVLIQKKHGVSRSSVDYPARDQVVLGGATEGSSTTTYPDCFHRVRIDGDNVPTPLGRHEPEAVLSMTEHVGFPGCPFVVEEDLPGRCRTIPVARIAQRIDLFKSARASPEHGDGGLAIAAARKSLNPPPELLHLRAAGEPTLSGSALKSKPRGFSSASHLGSVVFGFPLKRMPSHPCGFAAKTDDSQRVSTPTPDVGLLSARST